MNGADVLRNHKEKTRDCYDNNRIGKKRDERMKNDDVTQVEKEEKRLPKERELETSEGEEEKESK